MDADVLDTERDDRPREDQIVVLSNATWADYERILEIRGESRRPRLSYLDGQLEIMSPSQPHEELAGVIGCLVEVYCLERGIEFRTLGSWTVKDRRVARGVEADECYLFGERRDAARPDLAIEVVWTSGGLNKLEVYRELGVREVWHWRKGRLGVHVLRGGEYEATLESEVLPGIDLHQLASFLDRPTTSAAIREYRDALRSVSAPR